MNPSVFPSKAIGKGKLNSNQLYFAYELILYHIMCVVEELSKYIHPLSMSSRMTTIYPSGLNKGFDFRFPEGWRL